MEDRLRFGTFIAPFHVAGENPTLAIERDLELVAHLDRLGYDEAWIGEHHSAGTEIIASPEIFIAAAAERTRHIKLGTGVVSLSYHNPLWVTERIVQLDHMTRGRVMFGVGPGSLPTDASMINLSMSDTRELLEERFAVCMQLLTSDEPVNFDHGGIKLVDARLHLRPYSNPLFDIAVAAVASPSGPRLAGRYGVGLLSIGATMAAGFDVLGLHWDVMEERAATFGTTVSRRDWRLVNVVHVAETKEQAYKNVEYGLEAFFRYFQQTAAFPQMALEGDNLREMIEYVNTAGIGAIGTPDDVGLQIEALQKQSNGGFGAYLMLGHEWANPEATKRSFELVARHVMPEFQGQAWATRQAAARAAATREPLAAAQIKAVEETTARYEEEKKAAGH